jgi:phytanoyl-CoA hydroxylase
MASDRVNVVMGHLLCNRSLAHQDIKFLPTYGGQAAVSTPTSQFRFTTDQSILSPEQRQFYEDNGFVVIKKCISPERLESFRQRFQDICSGKVSTYGMTVMRDVAISKSEFIQGEKAITKIQDFQWDEVLFGYCRLPEVVNYVRGFAGENVMAMHTMLINKPPDPGTLTSRHPMHQDLYYFPFRPADKIVCAWTAMEPVTRQNGCLVVIPGSHKGEMLDHDYPEWEGGVNKMYHGVKNYNPERDTRVWLEMEAGDTVFFHPILIHGSGTNRTSGFRKAISCHYAASECYYIETEGSKQEKIAQEIIELVKKKTRTNATVPYKDVWKYRSRLVSGQSVNL